MTKEAAIQKLSSNLDQIRQFGVDRIGLFGSIARMQEHPESDVDIIVHFLRGQKTFDNFMSLKFFLETLFPDHQVDLVSGDALKPRIRSSVSEEAVYAS